jgi:hypothetical protein
MAAGLLGALLWIGPLGATDASAEIRQLEVVGVVPLDARTRRAGVPKDRAIEVALWEGVSRVAADLLMDSVVTEPDPSDGVDPANSEGVDPSSASNTEDDGGARKLRGALGKDMVTYTRSFRIVEDQGERPALFTDNPDAATEYVVVVAVEVDVDRVRDRLLETGLLVTGSLEILTGILVEVRGLTQYRGYEELVELIAGDDVGAATVSPLEFERGRAVLHVEAEWGAGELLERMLGAAPSRLRITPISVDEPDLEASSGRQDVTGAGQAMLVVSVAWTPPPPPEEDTVDPGSSRRSGRSTSPESRHAGRR